MICLFLQNVASFPGPTLIVDKKCLWKEDLCDANGSFAEQVGGLLAIYYLHNRNYPASYGQALGLIQEKVLLSPFPYKNKKLCSFLVSLDL